MWGRYIESELQTATRKAKTDQQAMQKAKQVMQRVLTDPERPEEAKSTAGRFRDPAARFK